MNHKSRIYAEQRANFWLAEYNKREESGRANTKTAQMCWKKAQYWLDRLNKIENM